MDEWYYTKAGQQKGPVSWDELRQMAGSGLLKPTDMVWKDGMGDWVAADKREGLFARSRPAKAAPAEDEARPRKRPRSEEADDDRPRKRSAEAEAEDDDRPRRRREEEEDDLDDRPRRRRRRASEGMSVGAKVAIIGGSVAVGLIVIVVVIVLLMSGGTSNPGRFTVTLLPGQQNWRMIRFNAGQNVTITVTSNVTAPNTDVDLFIARSNGVPIAADVGLMKDCRVNFVAPATESYKVSVQNLGPGHATCVVNIN